MGKATHNQQKFPGRKFMRSYTLGDYTFKVGMKIIWNYSSPIDEKDCDAEGRAFVKIVSIFEENGKVMFIPNKAWNGPFGFSGMTKVGTEDNFAARMDLRPWNINPRYKK